MSQLSLHLAGLLVVILPLTTSAQELKLVYDAVRTDAAVRKTVNKTDESIFNKQLLPAARRVWRSRQQECVDGWNEKPEMRGVVVGSFTKPQASQRAILYNYCTPAHAYAFNGLAVIENGRIVAHFAYQSDWQNDIASAADVNNNGLSEIVLVSGTTNQGTTWSAITIVEVSNGAIQKLGFTDVFSDNCGNDERTGEGEARKVFAKAATTPQFLRDTYKRGCTKPRWRRIKRLEPVTPSEDATDYKPVK